MESTGHSGAADGSPQDLHPPTTISATTPTATTVAAAATATAVAATAAVTATGDHGTPSNGDATRGSAIEQEEGLLLGVTETAQPATATDDPDDDPDDQSSLGSTDTITSSVLTERMTDIPPPVGEISVGKDEIAHPVASVGATSSSQVEDMPAEVLEKIIAVHGISSADSSHGEGRVLSSEDAERGEQQQQQQQPGAYAVPPAGTCPLGRPSGDDVDVAVKPTSYTGEAAPPVQLQVPPLIIGAGAGVAEPGAFAIMASSSSNNNNNNNHRTGIGLRATVPPAFDSSSNCDPHPTNCGIANPEAPSTAPTSASNSAPLVLVEQQQQQQQQHQLSQIQMMMTTVATAFRVEDSQVAVEEEIRNRILSEAVEANVVKQEEDEEGSNTIGGGGHGGWKWLAVILVLAVATIGVVLAVTLVSQNNSSSSSNANGGNSLPPSFDPTTPTIELVRERGYVRCGISGDIPGFSHANAETGIMEGMNIDYCRAISMAVFGTTDKIELVKTTPNTRFADLANGAIDVLAYTTTHTMGRDAFEASTRAGYVFSAPYLYTGLIFGGLPEFVDCGDRLDSIYGVCRSLKICVLEGTTHEKIINDIIPGGLAIPAQSTTDLLSRFANGACHVVVGELPSIPLVRVREAGYDGPFVHGKNLFSREPLSLVTRETDVQWSKLVNMIINVFYRAEADAISYTNANDLFSLLVVEDNSSFHELASMMEGVIAELGNYGDLYERNVEHILPRQGLNELHESAHGNNSAFGMLYSFPFGKVDAEGPDPDPESALGKILARGYIRCGVPFLPALAPMQNETVIQALSQVRSAFDVAFCQALAAAIFAGDVDAVKFTVLDNVTSAADPRIGTQALSHLLDNGTVDVVTGARVTLVADYQGYKLSTPYFYDNESMDAYALMTKQSDAQLGDLAFWVVIALIYAEENGIEPNSVGRMPVVGVFGESLKQCLRDCINLGSYGDIYNRTLQTDIPRRGKNLLNRGPAYGHAQYPLPFF